MRSNEIWHRRCGEMWKMETLRPQQIEETVSLEAARINCNRDYAKRHQDRADNEPLGNTGLDSVLVGLARGARHLYVRISWHLI